VARGQMWLWNRTDGFRAKEPAPSREAAERIYGYITELLDILQKEIGEHAFLAGDTLTIADCTAFPIFQTTRERFGLAFGNEHPRLDAWYSAFVLGPAGNIEWALVCCAAIKRADCPSASWCSPRCTRLVTGLSYLIRHVHCSRSGDV
jgi:hypothetical protein